MSLLAHGLFLANGVVERGRSVVGETPAVLQVVIDRSRFAGETAAMAGATWQAPANRRQSGSAAAVGEAAIVTAAAPAMERTFPVSESGPLATESTFKTAVGSAEPEELQRVAESAAARASHPNDEPRPISAESFRSIDSDEMSDFRLRFAAVATRFKKYPALARERGWEGKVDVTVALTPSRRTPEVTLTKSSGVELLDQAALDMVSRAVEVFDIPARLRGKAVRVVLPVDYRIDD